MAHIWKRIITIDDNQWCRFWKNWHLSKRSGSFKHCWFDPLILLKLITSMVFVTLISFIVFDSPHSDVSNNRTGTAIYLKKSSQCALIRDMEHFKPVRLFFWANLSFCTVIEDCTGIREIRVWKTYYKSLMFYKQDEKFRSMTAKTLTKYLAKTERCTI